jgi:hypothetical protein
MTLEINFELNDTDLEPFRTLFREAREKSARMEPAALARAAQKLVQSTGWPISGALHSRMRERRLADPRGWNAITL